MDVPFYIPTSNAQVLLANTWYLKTLEFLNNSHPVAIK
jgi:hypothetical protein